MVVTKILLGFLKLLKNRWGRCEIFSKHLRATVRKFSLCFFPNFLFIFSWKIQTQIQSNNFFKAPAIFTEFLEILRCRRENKQFSETLMCCSYSEFFRVVFSLDFLVFFLKNINSNSHNKFYSYSEFFCGFVFLKNTYSRTQNLLNVYEILWKFLQVLKHKWKNERLLKNTSVLQLFGIFLRLFCFEFLSIYFLGK